MVAVNGATYSLMKSGYNLNMLEILSTTIALVQETLMAWQWAGYGLMLLQIYFRKAQIRASSFSVCKYPCYVIPHQKLYTNIAFLESSVHDGDIVPMLASLGLFDDPQKLPADRIYPERQWKTSQIVPMGGRIVLERMTCSASTDHENSQSGVFIRFNVNDGIVALPGCESGPRKSCPLERFMDHVAGRGKLGGDFRKTCDLPEWAPDRLTFLKQPKSA